MPKGCLRDAKGTQRDTKGILHVHPFGVPLVSLWCPFGVPLGGFTQKGHQRDTKGYERDTKGTRMCFGAPRPKGYASGVQLDTLLGCIHLLVPQVPSIHHCTSAPPCASLDIRNEC